MRTHVKKKNYKAHVRSQTLSGLSTTADGNWVKQSGDSPCPKSVARNVWSGTAKKLIEP